MFSIAIDGPAGVGKSTVAKIIAKELGFIYVDTGAMYRTVALFCINKGIDCDDKDKVVEEIPQIKIAIRFSQGMQRVFLDKEDVTDLLRTMKVGDGSSKVASIKEVRTALVKMQQDIGNKNNVVMDGRDIGTHVLPKADLKIYLDAKPKIRAERRLNELLENGENGILEEIEKEIVERDWRDKNREESPLKMAENAVFIDASNLTIENVVDSILKLVKSKR